MDESADNMDSANIRPLSQFGILPTLIIPRSYRIEASGTLFNRGAESDFEFTACPMISTWRSHVSGKLHSIHEVPVLESGEHLSVPTVHSRPPANDPASLVMCWALPIWSSGEGAYRGDYIPTRAERASRGRFMDIEFESDTRFEDESRSARLSIDTRFNVGVYYALEYKGYPIFSMRIERASFCPSPGSSVERVTY